MEKTGWEEGLKKTIEWYLKTPVADYWRSDIEGALQAHPTAILGSQNLGA